jgi:isopenicillin-N N-acyltransferase-like protein
MRTVVLEGTHYHIGYRLGSRVKDSEIPSLDGRRTQLALKCEALVERLYPPIKEKVEGMIKGGNLDSRAFKTYFYARGGLEEVGCTSLAVLPEHTVDGSAIVAGNYDWFYEVRKHREVRLTRPQGSYASLSASHHWAGSPVVMNEHGLVVLLSALPEMKLIGPGLQWHTVIDIMMETCKDLGEARRLITSVPHLRAFNYLVADEDAAIAVEAAPDEVRVREPEDGILVVTNHFPGREEPEERLSEWDKGRQRRSVTRYKRAVEMLGLAQSSIDADFVKRILRDHKGAICRGDHAGAKKEGGFHAVFGTIWSTILLPSSREMCIAPGHPCRSQYRGYHLG